MKMRPRCFLGGVACEKRDRRWRIRAAEGPARGVKWFGSMDDGCVASCVACASHASCATSQTSFGAEVRNWDMNALTSTTKPSNQGAHSARKCMYPRCGASRDLEFASCRPVAPASHLFRLIFLPNLNVAAAHWQQLERLPRRERQPRCVFARVEGPGRRHARTFQRAGHTFRAGHVSYLALCCDATHSSARNTWGGRGRG